MGENSIFEFGIRFSHFQFLYKLKQDFKLGYESPTESCHISMKSGIPPSSPVIRHTLDGTGVEVPVPFLRNANASEKSFFRFFGHADVWAHRFFHFVAIYYGFADSQEREPAEGFGFLGIEPETGISIERFGFRYC